MTDGFVIGFNIPFQRIGDLVTTALEAPAGDWLERAVVGKDGIKIELLDGKSPWYSQGAYWSQSKASLTCTAAAGMEGEKVLTLPNFQHALVLLATAKEGAYAHHLADILAENDDAATADIFMQMAIFGEEVFS